MSAISTLDLSKLPSPLQLKRLLQSLALLDAIMSPEWEYRYYSFDAQWSPSETMGSMRNGSGDEFFALFNEAGCFLKGFSHEHWSDELHSAHFYKEVPDAFAAGVSEPAFSPEYVTFCLWATYDDTAWQNAAVKFLSGDDSDGSAFLLSDLDGRIETYQRFASQYYEERIPLGAIKSIYAHCDLTDELVKSLNSKLTVSDMKKDLSTIGYPAE